jgi:hypothetical protein
MQSYCNQVLENLNSSNLTYLDNQIFIPKGWIYAYMILDEDTYLKVVSNGIAYLVTDSANNSYQLLESIYAPWLYMQYSYLLSV